MPHSIASPGQGAQALLPPGERRALLEGLRRKVRALESPPPRWGAVALGAPSLPALARGAVHEAGPCAYLDGPAAAGFALMLAARAMAQAPGGAAIVWGPGAGEFGAPYAPGLARLGFDPARAVFVRAPNPAQTLAALEEAARTPGLSAVVGFAPVRLDLAQGRRLARAAEQAGAFVCLWRGVAALPLEGARTRWRIAAAASPTPAWGQGLCGRAPPGEARFCVTALKGRGIGQEALWEWRDATDGFHPSAPVAGAAARPESSLRRA